MMRSRVRAELTEGRIGQRIGEAKCQLQKPEWTCPLALCAHSDLWLTLNHISNLHLIPTHGDESVPSVLWTLNLCAYVMMSPRKRDFGTNTLPPLSEHRIAFVRTHCTCPTWKNMLKQSNAPSSSVWVYPKLRRLQKKFQFWSGTFDLWTTLFPIWILKYLLRHVFALYFHY